MRSKTVPALAILMVAIFSLQLQSADPPGLGDPGTLEPRSIETGREVDGVVTISGRDASQHPLYFRLRTQFSQ